jgi:hypothetical protein
MHRVASWIRLKLAQALCVGKALAEVAVVHRELGHGVDMHALFE